MIAGLIGMTQAKDIFSFFAFWELMSSLGAVGGDLP